jgi:hypothetical protein
MIVEILSAISQPFVAIAKLLKLGKDSRKTDLEIAKLQRDKEKDESPFTIASVDEIRTYKLAMKGGAAHALEMTTCSRIAKTLRGLQTELGFWY